MRLRDWLKESRFSVKSFAETVRVERAMVYRYFTGAIPRASTIRRIEVITDGAVTAQDFYENAMRREIDATPSSDSFANVQLGARSSAPSQNR